MENTHATFNKNYPSLAKHNHEEVESYQLQTTALGTIETESWDCTLEYPPKSSQTRPVPDHSRSSRKQTLTNNRDLDHLSYKKERSPRKRWTQKQSVRSSSAPREPSSVQLKFTTHLEDTHSHASTLPEIAPLTAQREGEEEGKASEQRARPARKLEAACDTLWRLRRARRTNLWQRSYKCRATGWASMQSCTL
jgi:hypothetical protein